GLREQVLEVGRWVELDLDLCGLDLGDGDLEPVRGPLRQLQRATPIVAAGLRSQRDLLGGADREDPRPVLDAVPGAQDHQAAAGPAEVAGLGQLPLHARGGQLEDRGARAQQAVIDIGEGGQSGGGLRDGVQIGAAGALLGQVHDQPGPGRARLAAHHQLLEHQIVLGQDASRCLVQGGVGICRAPRAHLRLRMGTWCDRPAGADALAPGEWPSAMVAATGRPRCENHPVSSLARPRAAALRPSRRRLLMAAPGLLLGAGGAAALSGCGTVRLGGPEKYTPPPPGIDDLYRTDLIALLDRAIAGTATVAEQESEDPARSADVSGALTALAQALPVQRTALLTGAQRERGLEAAEAPDPGLGSPPPPSDAPRELVAPLAVMGELPDGGTMAARQISGSLAHPVAAMAAHAHWSALRLQAAAGEGEVPAAASTEEIVPTREVPETDPPSIGAESDHHLAVETAQQQEWYAGYVHEVLAARTEDEAERSAHLESSTRHRTRAQGLAGAAEEDGAPVVARQAVYALPGGTLDDRTAGMLPTQLAQGLLVTHLAVVGAAPFERRPLSIAAALEEAGELASLRAELEPVPSLVPEDQDLAPQDEEPEAG